MRKRFFFKRHGLGRFFGIWLHGPESRCERKLEDAYPEVHDPDNAPDIKGRKAPYYWISEASAGWTLTSRFTGFTVAGNRYSVKWIFGVDGAVNAVDAGSGFAYLGFSYGAVSDSFSTSRLSGTVDYAHTTKLQEIQVFDQNGNRFYDFSVDNGNGNTFDQGSVSAVAAPEPGTLPLALSEFFMLIPARYLRRRSRPSRC